ncbi:hypothetical protein APHAL10511_006353 [Amanita phalloides]|nr:hypothetical protein APHAL10511_006353 [Amanita phalloides]
MIAALSKSAILYLAPLLALTAVFLSLFSFLAPVLMLRGRVSLLTVTPSTALFSVQATDVDGPSVFLGALGSCARHTNSAGLFCTSPSVSPSYNLSVLPENAPALLLSPPAPSTPVLIAIALSCSALFFITFTLTSLKHEKVSAAMEKPLVQRMSAWIGVLGFMIGLTAFTVIRMWFGKSVQDFNSFIVSQGNNGPKLIASLGNGFTMIWVAYAFYAVPLIVALAKLNIKKSKA